MPFILLPNEARFDRFDLYLPRFDFERVNTLLSLVDRDLLRFELELLNRLLIPLLGLYLDLDRSTPLNFDLPFDGIYIVDRKILR